MKKGAYGHALWPYMSECVVNHVMQKNVSCLVVWCRGVLDIVKKEHMGMAHDLNVANIAKKQKKSCFVMRWKISPRNSEKRSIWERPMTLMLQTLRSKPLNQCRSAKCTWCLHALTLGTVHARWTTSLNSGKHADAAMQCRVLTTGHQ